jgi:drug/metabolite transporter (DMT)-like permease
MSDSRVPVKVYVFIVVGLLSFGFSPILIRFADEGPGVAIAVWRTVFAAGLLAPVAIPKVVPAVRRFSRRERVLIIASGIFLGVHFIAWIKSLYFTSVASASVLVTSSPIFIAILGYLFLNERLTRRTAIAIVLGISGSVLLSWGDYGDGQMPNALLGNSLAFLAAVLVSFYLIIGRYVRRRVDWLTYVFPLYTIVAVTTLAGAFLFDVPLLGYNWSFYGWCALMAIGPQIVGHGSFNYALGYMPAVLLGLLTLTEPIIASILAYFLFGEVPKILAAAGMTIVLIGVTIAILQKEEKKAVGMAGETSREGAPGTSDALAGSSRQQ